MSLINDAIKRAAQTPPPPPPGPSADAPPLLPARYGADAPTPAVYLAVGLFALVLSVFFLVKGWRTNPSTAAVSPVEPVAARESATSPTDASPAVAAASVASSDPTATPAETRHFTLDEPVPTPPAPTLKLQGIFFRQRNPSALVNGKTVMIGDRLGEARVLAIDRSSVTVEAAGHRQVLTLP